MQEPSGGGHVIASRYQLVKQLGRGGMGSVWWARDLTLGSPVAVKLIDATLATDEGLRARFYQEAKAAAALRSPHVVQIFDYGVDRGIPYIAMELLEGESLADRLARVRVLPYAETARVISDVARAMKKAHDAGIVHRDLKPDNIFLVRNDDQEVAKVLDFGIAKTTKVAGAQAPATRTGAVIGTLPYMSPEQAMGEKVDWRTDLWALGVIAFECVCGRLPFTSNALGELVIQICVRPQPVPSQLARVPPGFDAFWARAATRDLAGRFQSAKQLADALAAVLGEASRPSFAVVDPSLLPPPDASAMTGDSSVITAVWAGKPRRRLGAIVAGGVGVVVAGLAIAWFAARPGSPPPAVALPSTTPVVVSVSVPVPVVAPAPPEPSVLPDVTASPGATSSASSSLAPRRPLHGAPTSTVSAPPEPPRPPATVTPPKRTMD